MGAIFGKSGSTRQWRALRQAIAHTLPRPCPYCDELVMPGDTWHLDHRVPRAFGGSDLDVRPAHATCNIRAGHEARQGRMPRVQSVAW